MKRVLLLFLFCAGGLPGADATYDGSRVHYESYGTGKDAIIFIHGWTCDLTFWRSQAPVYEKRRALLIDLPGHGRSEKPDVPYSQERFARAIEAVMRDAGVERAVLVGHSMGGPVAFTFLRLFPARTKALVLVDAHIPSVPRDNAERAAQKSQMMPLARAMRAPNYRETAETMIAGMFSDKTTPAQREEIRSKMMATPQNVMASAMEGLSGLEPPKQGETYSLHVLVIMAAGPGVGYESQLRTVFPNLTYEQWQNSGHFLMIESPQRFNRALSAFLARIETPAVAPH